MFHISLFVIILGIDSANVKRCDVAIADDMNLLLNVNIHLNSRLTTNVSYGSF